MVDVIVGLIVAAVIILAVRYIVISKKKGQACIGCPSSGSCPYKNKSNSSCGDINQKK